MGTPDFDILAWSAMEAEVRRTDEGQRAAGAAGERRYMSLHPDAAAFLYHLALALRAQRVVEVGTSAGYSTLWLARACAETGGRVTTFERDEAVLTLARDHFARAGVAHLVDLRPGDARALLAEVTGPVDLAFVDAEKSEYLAYGAALWPLLRPGGSLVADNVLSHRAETKAYLEAMLARDDASTLTLGIGRGLGWTIKK
jgi:predicted O-methyltransferase YrrM